MLLCGHLACCFCGGKLTGKTDKLSIGAVLSEVLGGSEGSVDTEVPEAFFRREDVLTQFLSGVGFPEQLRWTKSAVSSEKEKRYRFSSDDVFPVVLHVIAAQAARGSCVESCCIRSDVLWEGERVGRNDGDYVGFPLMKANSDTLAQALRLRSMPGARGADVGSCFFRDCFDLYLRSFEDSGGSGVEEAGIEIAGRPVGDWNRSLYKAPDTSVDPRESNGLAIVANGLFQALVFRLTGNTLSLDKFSEWKKARMLSDTSLAVVFLNMCLPLAILSSTEVFCMFLYDLCGGFDGSVRPVVSQQHPKFS